MRAMFRIGLAMLATLAWTACGEDPYGDPNWDAGSYDGGHRDSGPRDVAVLPDRIINPDGPAITILQPTAGQVLSGDQVQLVALISDDDGVQSSTVKAVIPGGQAFSLNRSGSVPDQFAGIVDLRSIPSGDFSILVQAADSGGIYNSAIVAVERDTGPTVEFISPEDGGRFAGSVNLNFIVSDPHGVEESSVTATIGQVVLEIAKTNEDDTTPGHPAWIQFGGEIVFDDLIFNPALTGVQQITVRAENMDNSVSGTTSITFVVDDAGPTIDVLTPTPGEILGGIIEIQADVQDDAGVLDTSVVAVLGHNSVEYTVPLVATGGGPYRGTFDSRQFPRNWLFPSISVRAADQLNNESEVGFLVALDNTAPIASLDPPVSFYLAQLNASFQKEASRPFDPVGPGVPNDTDRVPQIFFLRARIEDQGNQAAGLTQQPIALVDRSSVRLYVLDDTSRALVVDTDGDGFCDEINPLLQPSTNPQTTNEVLALLMEPITPGGSADYRPLADPLPAGVDTWGSDDEPPPPLCSNTEDDGGLGLGAFTRAINYTVDPAEPAIYSLPTVMDGHPIFCAGHQFDALANAISEGWACVAIRAEDNVGNVGVSTPLRIFVDYTLDGQPFYDPATAPACTGTWNPQTQTVDTGTPCQFDPDTQLFRANQVRREDL